MHLREEYPKSNSTHCILMDSSTVICLTSPFVILGVSGLLYRFYLGWKILLPNNVVPDQMLHYVASYLCLHGLPMTLLLVSR